MKRYKCLLLAFTAALLLCACGDGEATEPDTGVYVAKTGSMMGIEMSVGEIFGQGFKLDLRDNGKGRIYYDGDDARFKWTLDGTDFSGSGGGADLNGTMKNGVLELTNVMDTGIDLTLVCEEGPAAGGSGTADNAEGSVSGSAPSTLLGRLKAVKNGEQVYEVAEPEQETSQEEISEEEISGAEPAEGDTASAFDDASDAYGASFAGDWEGMTFIYDSEGATQTAKMGKTEIKDDSVYGTYARIWFDDDGQVKMDMVCVVELPEMNYTINNASFDEETDTLYIDGKMLGGEFSTFADSPELSNGVLTFSGRTNGDIKSNYVVYLKRLDSDWERSDASMISDKEYNIYITNNLPHLEGKTLEERVEAYTEAGVEVDMSDFLEPAP